MFISSASASMKQQIAALFSTHKESIELRFIDVQKQSGTNDCGLNAITACCFGKSPSGLVFDQSLMKQHLRSCFEQSKMTMLPVLKTRRHQDRIKHVSKVKVRILFVLNAIL